MKVEDMPVAAAVAAEDEDGGTTIEFGSVDDVPSEDKFCFERIRSTVLLCTPASAISTFIYLSTIFECITHLNWQVHSIH